MVLRKSVFKDLYRHKSDEWLFYRLDKRKKGYYLSAMQYVPIIDDNTVNDLKRERLEKYIKWKFEQAIKESNTPLDIEVIRKTDPRRKQSGIAMLFFNDDKNKPSAVLNELPKIHKRFYHAINSSDLLTLQRYLCFKIQCFLTM
jgi:hypothetical protein